MPKGTERCLASQIAGGITEELGRTQDIGGDGSEGDAVIERDRERVQAAGVDAALEIAEEVTADHTADAFGRTYRSSMVTMARAMQ